MTIRRVRLFLSIAFCATCSLTVTDQNRTAPTETDLAPGTADQARDDIYPRLHDLMVTITGDSPALNGALKQQLVDWYLHRVDAELDGPLTDAIAKIPKTYPIGYRCTHA
jgi:hypothetical protein